MSAAKEDRSSASDPTAFYRKPDAPVTGAPETNDTAVRAAAGLAITETIAPPSAAPLTGVPNTGDTGPRAAADPASAMPETLVPSSPPLHDSSAAPGAADRPAEVRQPRTPILGYEIMNELGRGGAGVVYKARQARLNRLVALKMILAGEFASQESSVRFLAEAETIASLHHPNIVQVYEFGNHEGFSYFTLEYLEGGTLEQRLTGTPWPAPEAARIAETLAHAMHYAHRRGIVHRDLKPGNVLFADDGTLKITDFGLAKRVEVVGSNLTRSGSIMGTPNYMAPEQAQGDNRHVGPAADIYALGAILYELLAGRPPFCAETPVDTIMQLLEQEPVPPSRLNPKCPRDLETIVLKCLQKPASKRYATAEELAADLKRFQNGEPIQARRAPWRERAARWVRKRPAVAALIAVCVVALAAFLAYGWWYNLHLQRALLVAEQQQRIAEEQRQAAEEQKRIAEEERRVVEAEKTKVEQNLAKRADVIDLFLDHVDGRLANSRGMESVRLEFLTETDKLSQQLLEDRPNDPQFRRQAGRIYRGLGELYQRGAKSEAAYAKAAEIQAKVVQEFPEDVAARMDLTLTRSRQAAQHTRARRFDAALKAYVEAIELQDGLRARFPDKEDYLMRSAYYRWMKANVLEEMEQLEQALPLYRLAVELQEELVKRVSRNPSYQQDLSLEALSLGYALEAGDPAGARPWFERSVAAAREAYLLQGKQASRDLRLAYSDLYYFCKRHGLHAELLRVAESRRRDFSGDGGETYNSACYVCDAARAAADNPELSGTERTALVDTYCKKALELLQKSVEEGFTDRARMTNDSDLDVLRGRADFKEYWVLLDKRFPNNPVTPAKLFQDLKSVYDRGAPVYQSLMTTARTAAEKKRAQLHKPSFEHEAKRVIELAEKHPAEASSLEALAWVLEKASVLNAAATTTSEERRAARSLQVRAMQVLERDHLTKKNFSRVCKALGGVSSTQGDNLLRAATAKSPEMDVRALAAYYLAESLGKQAQQALERGAANAEELSRQAEKQFEDVIKQYGTQTFNDKALADYVRKPLDELRTLSPGRTARPIEGEDLDGKPLKLDDFRGKVVLIDFWADWCGFCRQASPMQVALAQRMKGRPFAIFGVNTDADREAAKRGVQRGKMTWPSLWDGDGKIRGEWQVDGFPHYYLLDQRGVIRKRIQGLPDPGELEEEVEKLVRAVEVGKKT